MQSCRNWVRHLVSFHNSIGMCSYNFLPLFNSYTIYTGIVAVHATGFAVSLLGSPLPMLILSAVFNLLVFPLYLAFGSGHTLQWDTKWTEVSYLFCFVYLALWCIMSFFVPRSGVNFFFFWRPSLFSNNWNSNKISYLFIKSAYSHINYTMRKKNQLLWTLP